MELSKLRYLTGLVVLVLLTGCAKSLKTSSESDSGNKASAQTRAEVEQKFRKNFSRLTKNMEGTGKQDIMGYFTSPCDKAEQLLVTENGRYLGTNLGLTTGAMMKGGFSAGVATRVAAGPEVVADLSEYEIAVGVFAQSGLAANNWAGIDIQGAVSMGIAGGLDNGIKEFFRRHYELGAEAKFTLSPGTYVTTGAYAWSTLQFDESDTFTFVPTEANGAYGVKFPVGAMVDISLGSALESLIGVSLNSASIKHGHREHFAKGTEIAYEALDKLDDVEIAGFGLGLNPRLVTASGEPCSEAGEDALCRIRIGHKDDSATKRAAKLGLAMNTITGSISNPMSLSAMAVATLIGATKDADISVKDYCNLEPKIQANEQ